MTCRQEKKKEENYFIRTETIPGKGEYVVEEPIYYRINDDNTGPELLLEVCNERGWRSWDVKENAASEDGNETPHEWQIWWRHSFPGVVYRRLKHTQVLNHIARGNGLCRKDTLARTLQKMNNAFPQAFDFSPPAFLLPGDYTKLVAEYTRILYQSKSIKNNATSQEALGSTTNPLDVDASDEPPLNVWICKPTGSSQGKGITLFKDLHELTYGGSAVVQRYLEHPLLVGGYKCDIRLYVLVTSFVPLSIYIYSEGVVRFGTEKYDLKNLDNQFSHLTNTSINRMSPGYKKEKNRIGTGCKWTLRQLRRHLRSSGQRDWLLWQKVNVLVTLTLLTQVGRLSYNWHGHLQSLSDQPRYGTCFELYGFDILVDENLTPWLLEVNRCPSLTYDCDVDRVVKKPLLHHLFDLVGLPKVSQAIECSASDPNSGALSSPSKDTVINTIPALTDREQKEVLIRSKRSSLCEDWDDSQLMRNSSERPAQQQNNAKNLTYLHWRKGLRSSKSISMPPRVNRILNALNNSERNITASRRISHSGKISSNNIRRERSTTSQSEVTLDSAIMAEETSRDTYVPPTNNFQRLRNQLISDFSLLNRYHESNFNSLSSLANQSKPLSQRKDGRPQHKQPSKCGDWIRTFPYNAATLHGSRNPLYVKSLVAELLKYRKVCEKVFREEISADDDLLDHNLQKLTWGDHMLWSPKKM